MNDILCLKICLCKITNPEASLVASGLWQPADKHYALELLGLLTCLLSCFDQFALFLFLSISVFLYFLFKLAYFHHETSFFFVQGGSMAAIWLFPSSLFMLFMHTSSQQFQGYNHQGYSSYANFNTFIGTQKQLRYLKRLLVSQSTIIFLSIVSEEFSLMLASANYVEVILLPSQIHWSDTRCASFCHKDPNQLMCALLSF